ncbi:hypothetical protein D9M68_806130 [compost metagenome]
MKCRHITNQVVRRQHQQNRVIALSRSIQGGQRNSRRSITPLGFQQDLRRLKAHLTQLFSRQKTVLFVANQTRYTMNHTIKTRNRGLKHGDIISQRQELLGVQLPGQGP